MEILVNGEPLTVAAECTIEQFLHEQSIPADRVAVELDGRIVRKTDWASTPLHPGSKLEIVHFVGGGRR